MILDSTKIKDYISCPRYYLLRHIFNWALETPPLPLGFGIAWHKAKEVVLDPRSRSPRDVARALDMFLESYRGFYPDQDYDQNRFPRSPEGALEGLLSYVREYKDDSFKVVYCEEVGLIPLASNLDIVFRADAIIEDEKGRRWIVDSKTTGSSNPAYREVFNLSIQFDIYLIGVQQISPVEGLIVDVSEFRKKKDEVEAGHERLYVLRSVKDLEETILELDLICGRIMEDTDLQITGHSCAFPKSFSCIRFNRLCEYFDVCSSAVSWKELDPESPPPGFVVREWDPLEREKKKGGDQDVET